MSNKSSAFVGSVGQWGQFTGVPPSTEPLEPHPLTDHGTFPDNVRQDAIVVHVAGLKSLLQFFRVTMASVADGCRTEHVVVSAYPPFPPDAVQPAARLLLSACDSAALCMIVEDRSGWARATSVGSPPQRVAAAVAHTKAAAGWDESDPIVVVVDGQEFHVSASFDGHAWKLMVRQH